MTFLGAPLSTLLPVFGAAGAALAVLYVLKLRRRRVEVPFAKLWAQVMGERESVSLWRRLKRLLSLLVQLLVLALVVLALADPRRGQGESGRTIALLVDASASMRAVDEAPKFATRIDRAKREARDLVAGLGAGDVAMIVRLDGQPLALGGLESDERELERQIDSLTPSDTPADLERALRLAGDALRGHPHPTLILVGDGAWPREVLDRVRTAPAATPSATGLAGEPKLSAIDLQGVDLRFVPVGKSGDNVGIVAFSVRRYQANKTSYEVMIEVQSFRPAPSVVKLELLQDGEVVDVERLELAAGQRVERFLPNLAGEGQRLEARLSPIDAKVSRLDDFPLDDRAFALLSPRKKQRVLLVTTGNLFVEGALLLNENADVDKLAPGAWDPKRVVDGKYDAVIFDAFTPPEPPAAPALYIDPRGAASPFRISGEAPHVMVTDMAEKHPLMRWVSLRDLNVSRCSRFALQPGDVALASSLRDPILVARDPSASSGSGRRLVALGFDVRHSDLPLRVGFPVLLVNVLEWFAGDEATLAASYRTGRTWRVAAPGTEALIGDPDHRWQRHPVVDGRLSLYGDRVGFYTLRHADGARDGDRSLAANLADPAESTILPIRELTVAGAVLGPPTGFHRGVRRELWVFLVLGALVLSLLEWWTYNRRITV